jgi:hypothetical protein
VARRNFQISKNRVRNEAIIANFTRLRAYNPLAMPKRKLGTLATLNIIFTILIYFTRFSRRSQRFVDAYNKGLDQGLDGKWAAWANKKYRGHRVLPDNIMNDLEEAKSS